MTPLSGRRHEGTELNAPPLVAIIDDDEDIRQSLETLVEMIGYRVDTFESAEAFLGWPLVGTTDCIVSDIHMKGLSGIELTRALNQAGHSIPVILISAYASDDIRRRAMDAGAACFLSKPFDVDMLVHRLKSLLRP
ncbi:MAG: response regulator [Bosea sp.]|nr:response regulator [Bosea sp. (in: a-proteobacteria)]